MKTKKMKVMKKKTMKKTAKKATLTMIPKKKPTLILTRKVQNRIPPSRIA